jgi:Spy/CpxP family protein refolding chaperone
MDRRLKMKRYALSAFLVILFLGFTLFPEEASGQPGRRQRRMMGSEGPSWFEKYLDLTPEQKKKLDEMKEMRLEQKQNFWDKLRKIRLDLGKLMEEPEADEKKIEALIDEVAELRAGHFKGSLKHKKEVRKIFTAEQLEKIDSTRKRISKFRALRSQRFSQRWSSFGRSFFQQRRFNRSGFFPQRGRRPWGRRWDWRGHGFMNSPHWP